LGRARPEPLLSTRRTRVTTLARYPTAQPWVLIFATLHAPMNVRSGRPGLFTIPLGPYPRHTNAAFIRRATELFTKLRLRIVGAHCEGDSITIPITANAGCGKIARSEARAFQRNQNGHASVCRLGSRASRVAEETALTGLRVHNSRGFSPPLGNTLPITDHKRVPVKASLNRLSGSRRKLCKSKAREKGLDT
jgi:hypothetical protein